MRRKLLAAAAAACALSHAPPAEALSIVLQDGGGFASGPARGAFLNAAKFWGDMFTNDVTVTIKATFATNFAPGGLGSTTATLTGASVGTVEASLKSVGVTPLDAIATAHLPARDAGGGIDMITPGYVNPATHQGIDTSYRVFDTNDTLNNTGLALTTANARALGAPFGTFLDATISFNGADPTVWDYNPTDGIGGGQVDFVGVAIHEIGHVLGFASGVDTYDRSGRPARSGQPSTFPENGRIGGPLDLFRYSANPDGFDHGEPLLDWSPGAAAYFSIDGGASAFLGGRFSTGAFNGDHLQASHWKESPFCGQYIGIMEPSTCPGDQLFVTALDLAAFDAIGWNPRLDVLANPTWSFSTRSVPEPGAWALMLSGAGLAGAALRRARRLRSVAGPR